jgi:pimeloyl-ACP methyl ester carboxylesterase
VTLAINGSTQRIRMCAERAGLPPLLIVQGGPALPLLHEVPKFQRCLHLESDFLMTYWDQRGCGPASRADADGVSVLQQVADVRAVLQWLHQETQQAVTVLGISVGGTFALQAVEHEPDIVQSVIVISPDADTARSDAAAYAFLQEQSSRPAHRGLRAKVEKLGEPPYTDSAAFQLRARLLTDLGAIERGMTFNRVLREMLFGLLRAYGPVGTAKALRNMNIIQNRLLPQVVSLNLLAHPPRLAMPVHYVFGEQDALTPPALAEQLPAAIAAPGSTAVRLPDAAHMLHFDQPEIVRAIVLNAR